MQYISIRGARTHNLQNLDLDLPRDRLIVITGLSGSGKSSLAFDTIYAEGQRRYVESLSAYARQFLSMMDKPDVDHIEGLSPAISIEQKTTSHNPRSTVGTVTEIYDYLRLLYARAGTPRCPNHDLDLLAQTVSQMVDQVLALPEGTRLMLLAPVVQARKGEHMQLLAGAAYPGLCARTNRWRDAANSTTRRSSICAANTPSKWSWTASRSATDVEQRLAESFETALKLADGVVRVASMDPETADAPAEMLFSDRFACPVCGYSIAELEPRLFSFNNPAGACPSCDGLGVQQFFDPERVVRHPDSRSGRRRNPRLGPPQRLLLFHAAVRWPSTTTSTSNCPTGSCRNASGTSCSTAAAKKIQFRYLTGNGASIRRKHPFEGILPNLERRYRETESGMVREELARLPQHPALPGLRRHPPERRRASCVCAATARLPQ